MDMSQYLEIFIEESKEHLQNLNQNLLLLEKSPNDMSTLNEIFRVAHTLKGIAGTMGFTKMSTLTHDMENVLQTIRNGEITVTSNLVDLLFKCLDALENYVNEVINTGSEGDKKYDDIIKELNDIIKNKGKAEEKKESSKKPKAVSKVESKKESKQENIGSVLLDGTVIKEPKEQEKSKVIQEKAQKDELDELVNYKVTIKLNPGCLLKSARAFIIFQTLEKYCKVLASNPSTQDIEEENFDDQFSVIVNTKQPKEQIIKDLNKIAEVDEVIVEKAEMDEIVVQAHANVEEDVAAVKVAELQKVQDVQEDKVLEEVEEQEEAKNVEDDVTSSYKDEDTKPKVAKVSKPITSKTVRVDIGRLDNLMNLVSELIIVKNTLEDINSSEKLRDYNEAIEYLERITTSLHDAVMKVRMVPVESVFNRFPRMIRDLAKELNKEIILNMSGEETEVDRTVIDELGDPLIHLLRNAADHGIEEPSKRKALGKPVAGTINLRAYHDGNNVVIEVEDDGQGINIEKIKKKILEKKLATKDEVDAMSENELIQYLFRPSFSTAEKITDVSGRGVGLDVVKTKIEALGGEIAVETEYQKGCKFIIRLPLTLAIIQALLVNIGKEIYAIPLSSIKEIINVKEKEIQAVQNQEVYMLRNQVIPVVRLDSILDVPKDDVVEENKELTIVIIKRGEKLSGFIVDGLMGQQEIVIKSLGKYLRGIKTIAGATILGDGRVALILDVNSLA